VLVASGQNTLSLHDHRCLCARRAHNDRSQYAELMYEGTAPEDTSYPAFPMHGTHDQKSFCRSSITKRLPIEYLRLTTTDKTATVNFAHGAQRGASLTKHPGRIFNQQRMLCAEWNGASGAWKPEPLPTVTLPFTAKFF